MAFLSSIASAVHKVSVGRLCKNSTTNSAILLAFYGGFGGLCVTLPAAFLNHGQRIFSAEIVSISKTTWAALSTVASLGLVGFVAVNLSIKKTSPVFSSFVACIEIAFAYVAQSFIFDTVPNVFGIVGSIIVIGTVSTLPIKEIISQKMQHWYQRSSGN